MLDRISGIGGRTDSARGRRKGASGSGYIRLAGCLIGLASVLLPWGSVIVRDDTRATASITSIGVADLMTSSSAAVVIASVLFMAATLLVLLDGRAVIGQVAALIILFITMPDLLADIASNLPPAPPGWSVSTSIALGFYLGVLSAAVLVIPFLRSKRPARWESQAGHAESHYRPEDFR